MNIKNVVIFVFCVIVLVGCSAPSLEMPPYRIKDQALSYRPLWHFNAMEWARTHGNVSKYRYFSVQATSLKNMQLACSQVKNRAYEEVALRIIYHIQRPLEESDPTQLLLVDKVYEKTISLLPSSLIYNTYWEKREYFRSLGATNNYNEHLCAALIRIEEKKLKKIVSNTIEYLIKKINPKIKDEVASKLKNVYKKFNKEMMSPLIDS